MLRDLAAMWMELRHEFTIKKVKEANGDELFEKILWGMVLVVVRRHGASESAARRTITQRRILHSTVAARR